MKGDVCIPETFCVAHNLFFKYVHGKYIRKLWEAENQGKKELRLLYHMKGKDMYPDNFQKIKVGATIRFFNKKTASAIEVAVHMKQLPFKASTTAHFIRLIQKWFSIVNSRTCKTSITTSKRGCEIFVPGTNYGTISRFMNRKRMETSE